MKKQFVNLLCLLLGIALGVGGCLLVRFLQDGSLSRKNEGAAEAVTAQTAVLRNEDLAMLASGVHIREVSVSSYGSGTENGVSFDSYELRMGGDFERPVEVTFPCRIDGDTDVSLEHYEDGEWVPLLSFVDASAGTVSA